MTQREPKFTKLSSINLNLLSELSPGGDIPVTGKRLNPKIYAKAWELQGDIFNEGKQLSDKAVWRRKIKKILTVAAIVLALAAASSIGVTLAGIFRSFELQLLIGAAAALSGIFVLISRIYFNEEKSEKLIAASEKYTSLYKQMSCFVLAPEPDSDEALKILFDFNTEHAKLREENAASFSEPSSLPKNRFERFELPPVTYRPF